MTKDHGVVALIKRDEKFLLLKDSRELMLDYWGPPHGRCEEADEDEQASVRREVLEETGLQVNPQRKIWTTEADTKVKTVSFWLTEVVGGEIVIDKQESSEYGWFSLDEALNLKLYPGTKKFITLVKQGIISF
jgi:8-oxo-dGTP pyrophosphatase MutT (NUDIX family)